MSPDRVKMYADRVPIETLSTPDRVTIEGRTADSITIVPDTVTND